MDRVDSALAAIGNTKYRAPRDRISHRGERLDRADDWE